MPPRVIPVPCTSPAPNLMSRRARRNHRPLHRGITRPPLSSPTRCPWFTRWSRRPLWHTWGAPQASKAGAAGAPRKIEHDRAHHDWPVSRIRAGKTMLVGDLEDRFGQLHVHPQLDGGRRLELRGELDLTAAKALRTPLPDQLTGSGPVTLDPDGRASRPARRGTAGSPPGSGRRLPRAPPAVRRPRRAPWRGSERRRASGAGTATGRRGPAPATSRSYRCETRPRAPPG